MAPITDGKFRGHTNPYCQRSTAIPCFSICLPDAMGKARRPRQKLHLPAAAAGGRSQLPDADPEEVPMAIPAAAVLPPTSTGGVFAGLRITPEALQQRLPDFDARSVRSDAARSVRSTKSTVRGQAAMKKKDKRKIRREAFMQSKR